MTNPFSLYPHLQFDCRNLDSASSLKRWFIFSNDCLLLNEKNGKLIIPCSVEPPLAATAIAYSRCIGRYADMVCMAVELRENSVAETYTHISLREAFQLLSNDSWGIAGRASQILDWHRQNRYCGSCGTGMQEQSKEFLKTCPQCGFLSYPRLSPAVIMSIIRDNEILLGRSPHFPSGMYSTLAGFVEPGETLEDAVRREIKEEVNIDVTKIRYVASQPWPFPHSLMIGFSTRYAGGELQIDKEELEDAGWFSPDQMPRLPSSKSVARLLIDHFLDQYEER